jgi:hypothetical protein
MHRRVRVLAIRFHGCPYELCSIYHSYEAPLASRKLQGTRRRSEHDMVRRPFSPERQRSGSPQAFTLKTSSGGSPTPGQRR